MKNSESTILVLSLGSQKAEILTSVIRRHGINAEVASVDTVVGKLNKELTAGLIITGEAQDVNDTSSVQIPPEVFKKDIPILALGYGAHAMVYALGGKVASKPERLPHRQNGVFDTSSPVFSGFLSKGYILNEQLGAITEMPDGFTSICHSDDCKYIGIADNKRRYYAMAYYPGSENGAKLIDNFIFGICNHKKTKSPKLILQNIIDSLREKIGDEKILVSVSSGMPSLVCSLILAKAFPDRCSFVTVNHPFTRKYECEDAVNMFSCFGISVKTLDCTEKIKEAVKETHNGIERRTIVTDAIFDTLSEEIGSMPDTKYLVMGSQRTSYLPSNLLESEKLGDSKEVVLPFASLYRNEIKSIGSILGIAPTILSRLHNPIYGFCRHIYGDYEDKKVDITREADSILLDEMQKTRCRSTELCCCVIDVPMKYPGYAVIIRAIASDGLDKSFVQIPYRVLSQIAYRIKTEVHGVNYVAYDTSFPLN